MHIRGEKNTRRIWSCEKLLYVARAHYYPLVTDFIWFPSDGKSFTLWNVCCVAPRKPCFAAFAAPFTPSRLDQETCHSYSILWFAFQDCYDLS